MSFDIVSWIIKIPVLLFSLTIHECAHGKAALSLGDATAKEAGRITLNPFSHLAPLGAFCLFFFNFGWARAVPVDMKFFKRKRSEMVIMSLSGPLANIGAAFITGIFIRYFILPWDSYLHLLINMIQMNIGLGIFNVIPIPPLDGSHVLENFLPSKVSEKYRRIRMHAPRVLITILVLDRVFNLGIYHRLLGIPISYLAYLFGGENFITMLKLL